jgi:hypothetical protein
MQSNATMIHKLQNAINQNFDAKILYNKQQWYSKDQNRPVNQYVIRKAYEDIESGRMKTIELFSSCSQIQIVLYLRDYWYELNGWDVPQDNEMWNKAKQKYLEKQEPNDINPVMKRARTRKKRNVVKK